jgi:hypothetical protein
MDASRVRPPGSRVRPSKVPLGVARPAGATRREAGTGRRPRIFPAALYRRTDGSVSEETRYEPSRSTARPSESRAAPVSSARGTTDSGARVLASRPKSAERSERAASEPSSSTASAERLPTKVSWWVVLSRASEKPWTKTVGEQACGAPEERAFAGPAAERQAAAARPAVRVASTVRRRMAVTVGRAGDGRWDAPLRISGSVTGLRRPRGRGG